ncbi:N/A [soil metagenome]
MTMPGDTGQNNNGPIDANSSAGASWNPGAVKGGGNFKDKIGRLAGGYSRTQKIVAAVAVVGVIAAVFFVSSMTGGTEWSPLYTNVSAEDGGAIVAQLEEQGVPHELADGGATIMVPAEQVYDLRLSMADTALPSTSKVGYGVLDSQGLNTSEFGQRVGYQRAMEGELAATIEALDPVDTAVVHLAIPEDQVFALADQKPSASVLLKTNGTELTEDQVRAVVNLVASGIEGMSPDDVTVADSDGNVLAAPGQGVTGSAGGGNGQRQTDDFEAAVSASLKQLMNSVVGPDSSQVTVSAALNYDQTNVSSETFQQPAATAGGEDLVLEESTKNETFTGAGAAEGGVLGPDTPASVTGAAGGNSDYSLDERDVKNAVNRVVESKQLAPGQIENLSVAVLVDESKITAEQAAQLTTTLSAGAGIQAARGDVLTVTRMPFDDTAAKSAAAELKSAEAAKQAESSRKFVQNLAIVAFLVLLLIVAAVAYRIASRRSRKGQLALGAGDDTPALPPGSANAAMTMLDEVDAAATDVVALSDEAEELVGNELVVGEIYPQFDELELDDVHRIDREATLTDLIDNQPEEVAALLRGWLGDRRGVSR